MSGADWRRFLEAVEAMRGAQRRYLAARTTEALKEAKGAEAYVDKLIKEARSGDAPSQGWMLGPR